MNAPFDWPLVALFGRPLVHCGAVSRPLLFRYHKTVALFGYLASQPRREIRREELADLLWPAQDMQAGRANLRGVLADLRAQWLVHGLPEGAIQVHREWIAFQPVAGVVVDTALLSPLGPRDALPPECHAAWAGVLSAQPDAWLAGAEDGTSERFGAWLVAQRLRLDRARTELANGASRQEMQPRVSDAAEPDPAHPSAWLPSGATTVAALLRLQLPDVAACDDQPSVPALSAQLATLGSIALCFGGLVLDVDDAGCTLGFGFAGPFACLRTQALQCAAGLAAAMPAGQLLRAGATHGAVVLERAPRLRATGWRMRLVERLAQRAEAGELVCDDSMADAAVLFGCRPMGAQRFRGLGRDFMLFGRPLHSEQALCC